MGNRPPFAPEEWYHCFSRTVSRDESFKSEDEYERFIQLLYLANDVEPVHRSTLRKLTTDQIIKLPRKDNLVEIGAYCLMPSHFHLLLKARGDGGISSFMRKLLTAYTMYFNIRHERIGNLFIVPFRSKHVGDDMYFQRVIQYIHFNPAELFEPGWKSGSVFNLQSLQEKLLAYRYSSYAHLVNANREHGVLGASVFDMHKPAKPVDAIKEALDYYQEVYQGGTLIF